MCLFVRVGTCDINDFLTWASVLCGSLPSQLFVIAGMLFFRVWLCIFFPTVGSTPVSAGVQPIYVTGEGGKSADHAAMYNVCLVSKIVTKSCHKCHCNITLYNDILT
jgi:hypothetical protein